MNLLWGIAVLQGLVCGSSSSFLSIALRDGVYRNLTPPSPTGPSGSAPPPKRSRTASNEPSGSQFLVSVDLEIEYDPEVCAVVGFVESMTKLALSEKYDVETGRHCSSDSASTQNTLASIIIRPKAASEIALKKYLEDVLLVRLKELAGNSIYEMHDFGRYMSVDSGRISSRGRIIETEMRERFRDGVAGFSKASNDYEFVDTVKREHDRCIVECLKREHEAQEGRHRPLREMLRIRVVEHECGWTTKKLKARFKSFLDEFTARMEEILVQEERQIDTKRVHIGMGVFTCNSPTEDEAPIVSFNYNPMMEAALTADMLRIFEGEIFRKRVVAALESRGIFRTEQLESLRISAHKSSILQARDKWSIDKFCFLHLRIDVPGAVGIDRAKKVARMFSNLLQSEELQEYLDEALVDEHELVAFFTLFKRDAPAYLVLHARDANSTPRCVFHCYE
jgi:hypothetical protein